MIYKQDIMLKLFYRKIKQEPFCWGNLFKPIKFELPKNKILDLHSLKLIQ